MPSLTPPGTPLRALGCLALFRLALPMLALSMLAAAPALDAQEAPTGTPPAPSVSPSVEPDSSAAPSARLLLLAASSVGAATWNQAIRAPEPWPRTWHGYGARLGDQVGFAVVEESLRAGFGAVVPWHGVQEPCAGARRGQAFGARVGAATRCAVRRTLLAHDPVGRTRPNVPFLGAVVGASAVSLAWRPERADAAKGQFFVASRIGIVLAGAMAKQAWGAWRGR